MESSILETPSLIPIFTSMFVPIYLLGYFTVFRNWDGKTRPEASSCLTSLAHGTPAVLLSLYSIFFFFFFNNSSSPNTFKLYDFAAPNTAFQNMVLDYSIAYFLTDTLHYATFFPSNYLFIAHHLAVLYVFATCRYLVSHGAFGVLGLLVLAEITSACQNVWSLTGIAKAEEPAAARLHETLSPVFFGFYSVVRGFLGPLFVWRMIEFYSKGGGEGMIPRWVWISWMVVIIGAIMVSILWVLNHWVELFRQRAKLRKLS